MSGGPVPTAVVPMPWYGGKSGKLGAGRWTARMLDVAGIESYIEPFAGMLGVLLQRAPARFELVNDLDGRVLAWWRAVREQFDDLAWKLAHTPHSRELFLEALEMVDQPDVADLERAWALHTVVNQSLTKSPNSDEANWVPAYWSRQDHAFCPKRLRDIDAARDAIGHLARRLRLVQLEHKPAEEIIKRVHRHQAGDKMLVYSDPPFAGKHRGVYGCTEIDAELLMGLYADATVKMAVAGMDDDPWFGLESEGYQRLTYNRRASIDCAPGENRPQVQYLWVNFTPAEPTLF